VPEESFSVDFLCASRVDFRGVDGLDDLFNAEE
jgi:hypothetical protein